jgi:plastocyanin
MPLVGRRSRRLVLPVLAAAFAAALLWGLVPGARLAHAQTGPGPTLHISMKDFAFMPAKPPPIKVGTTVTWTYDESATDLMPNCETPVLTTQCPGHTATATTKGPDGKPLFNSPTLKKAGASYSFTFTKPGTYAYYCIYHGGTTATGKNNPITNMNGTIVVEGAAAATPTPTTAATATTVATHVLAQSTTKSANNAAGLANTGGPSIFGWALTPIAAGLTIRLRSRRQKL